MIAQYCISVMRDLQQEQNYNLLRKFLDKLKISSSTIRTALILDRYKPVKNKNISQKRYDQIT